MTAIRDVAGGGGGSRFDFGVSGITETGFCAADLAEAEIPSALDRAVQVQHAVALDHLVGRPDPTAGAPYAIFAGRH